MNQSDRAVYALYQPGLAVTIVSAGRTAGKTVVGLRLKNGHAGHMLPTGDPERFIRVDLAMVASGKIIVTQSLRIGQRWQWWPKAKKLGDNRLKPLEVRQEYIEFRSAQPATLRVSVSNCRLSEQNARYHNLVGRYPLEAQVWSCHVIGLNS